MKPLSIYIHIPFCKRKCSYCDFVSFDDKAGEVDKYVNALREEIKNANLHQDTIYNTIFLGGGTPSILSDKQVSRIFEVLPIANEITIEANPNSVNQNKLTHWQSLGINRISIGVQSFNNKTLKELGRTHTAKQAVNAINLAHEVGFRNINIDIIHSINTLPVKIPSEIFKYITHVSAYCLTPTTIDDGESIKQQKQIELTLAVQGLEKYEVSNFARPGFACRHNLAYWQPQTHEYLGFGLGAHSFVGGKRFSNTEDFEKYVSSGMDCVVAGAPRNDVVETIMLGLRTTNGVDVALFKNKTSQIKLLKDLKLIKEENGRISATSDGFFVLDSIIEKLT